uniref:Uncharacterized protein n=1 Tax=Lactuca sativa TaxID=4236 RepID=A0A9R1VXD5_LACSA|nr:hypothetical protein LSAT_V11C400204790 [Lactuca sativa]
MTSSSSSPRMQTRQQGTTITALQSQMIKKIATMVGRKSPINAFKCQLVHIILCLIDGFCLSVNYSCKLFRDSATSEAMYKTMNIYRLWFHPCSVDMDEVIRTYSSTMEWYSFLMHSIYYTCTLFSVFAKYFLLGEDVIGKQLLQDATDKGQLDAIFILGMLLMTEGSERKQEALMMLNNAYVNTRRS